MFALDPNARQSDVKLGDECYARYDDGLWYNAVLEDISDEMHGKVTFRNFKAPSGITMWVPLNDICNLSWGLLNFKPQGNFMKEYYNCRIKGCHSSGKLIVIYDEDGVEDKLQYDKIRLNGAMQSMFPIGVEVYLSVNNIQEFDLDEFCDEERTLLADKLNAALSTYSSLNVTAYGYEVTIPGDVLRFRCIIDLIEQNKCLADNYADIYRNRGNFVNVAENYDYDVVTTLSPLINFFMNVFETVGIPMTWDKYISLYATAKPHREHRNFLVDYYNEIVGDKNQLIRSYNSAQRSGGTFSRVYSSGQLLFSKDPNSIYYDPVALEALTDGIRETVQEYVRGFGRALNEYIGGQYVEIIIQEERSNELLDAHRNLSPEQSCDHAYIGYLFEALQLNPWEEQIYYRFYEGYGAEGFEGLRSLAEYLDPQKLIIRGL